MENEFELNEVIDGVCEVQESGNGINKLIIAGVVAVAGVGALLYKRHRDKKVVEVKADDNTSKVENDKEEVQEAVIKEESEETK